MALQEEFETPGNYLFRYRYVLPFYFLFLSAIAYIPRIVDISEKEWAFYNHFYFYICLAVTLTGFGIRIYANGCTPDKIVGDNINSMTTDELNTSGIYSLIRHPLYLGNFFIGSGIALLAQNIWFFLAFIFMHWVYSERLMYAEEQFLRNKFGKAFLRWGQRTPAFIPGRTKFIKPGVRFDIRSVLKKEKITQLLIFSVYFIFYTIGLSVNLRKIYVQFNFWFYALTFSLVVYLLLIVFGKNKFNDTASEGAKLFTMTMKTNNSD